MYKYKPARYIFRAFNLLIYAAAASIVCITIYNQIYISDVMNSVFHGYFMDSKRSLYLAIFLLSNMRKEKNAYTWRDKGDLLH